ncbi:MAG: phosphotransferase family protein [Steroidobacteraceae bacterium]
MTNSLQLLKHVRRVIDQASRASGTPEQRALLAAVETALNELMQQQSPQFYRNYLQKGRELATEGLHLGRQHESALAVKQPLILPPEDARFEIIQHHIEQLHATLLDIVAALDEGRSPPEKDYLVRLTDWENSLYYHRLEPADPGAVQGSVPLTAEALQQYLVRKFPQSPDVRVTSFRPLDGGFSKNTILFETVDRIHGPRSLVIRAELKHMLVHYEGSDVTQEFHLIGLMRDAGLPVAEPMWLEPDATQLGTRFIVSRRAEGKTYGGNLGSDEQISKPLLQSIFAALVHMHGVRIDPNDPAAQRSHLNEWLGMKTVEEVMSYAVTEHMPRLLRLGGLPMTPSLLRAFQWMERNVPDCQEPPVVVHLDFALNNLILDGERVTAVLDWESSRMGDPAEDLIWTQQNLSQYLSMPEMLRRYEAATGRSISAYRLAYARVVKCALNAITCIAAMRQLEQHDDAHIKLAVLGYRYMALFGAQFNELIEAAERCRSGAAGEPE